MRLYVVDSIKIRFRRNRNRRKSDRPFFVGSKTLMYTQTSKSSKITRLAPRLADFKFWLFQDFPSFFNFGICSSFIFWSYYKGRKLMIFFGSFHSKSSSTLSRSTLSRSWCSSKAHISRLAYSIDRAFYINWAKSLSCQKFKSQCWIQKNIRFSEIYFLHNT